LSKRSKSSGFSTKSLFTCYGLAEATLAVTMCRADRRPTLETVDADALTEGRIVNRPAGTPGTRELVCSGWPMSDNVLRVVDPETGRVCQEGEIGEIWTKGPSVTKGYWNQPEKTVECFEGYTNTGEGPFLRTGDAGFFREKEGLFVTGRLKDLIIIRGANHYPQDIELTVEQSHEALAPNAGAAFSVYTENGEQLVVIHELKRAALLTAPTQDIAYAILREISLRHALTPVAVVLLRPNGLFKTTSGKVQRSACQRAFLANNLAEHYRWDSLQLIEKQA
jgi:acyl-CoA synthetase (AMP-forming)/AMP-acid ligase II